MYLNPLQASSIVNAHSLLSMLTPSGTLPYLVLSKPYDVGTRFSMGLLMQPGKRAGQLASWKNAFPQKPFWRPWAHGSPLCACGSALGLFGLWPHMALASRGSGHTDHVRVMQRVAGPEA